MAKFVLPYETPILWSYYSLGEKLAEGDYGTTYLCLDKSTGEEFACKSISKTNNGHSNADVLREIEIMHRVSRVPSVVAFQDAYEDSEHVYLVTEHCDDNLFDRIIRNGSYCERDAVKVMKTLVEFVQSCHSRGVMHRDLKPENLLFKSKDHDSPLKVSGFGLAVFFHQGDTFEDIVGSPYYVAPEVLLNGKYGPEADVWSVGIILYILLSGVAPFWAETKEDIYHEIQIGTLDLESQQWSDISDNAKDLIKKMLDKDPEKRLSTYYVLRHPWMADESNVPDNPLEAARLKRFLEMNKLN